MFPNIGSVAEAETNGAIIKNYTTDLGSFVATALNPSGTYFFNVIVKDLAGNKASYSMRNVTTQAPPPDTTAPTPGNSGLITALTSSSSITLGWTKGTDDVSQQAALAYEVRRSTVANIDTVANAEANGVIVKAYTNDINAFVAGGLTPGTTYFFNVIVKDQAGNKSSYSMRSAATPTPDTTAPTPGNTGLITAVTSSNSITLGWTKATDNVSSQPALAYEVRRSTTANIDTVADAEANGIIVKAYTNDINAFVVTGLTPGTTYFFNVIVKDEAGNKSTYSMRNTATAPVLDTSAPTPGTGGQINASPNASGVTLTWAKATDNVSAASALKYEVRMSSTSNIDGVATAEANGTVVKAYTNDIDTFTVNNLQSGTMYYFNIIVMDEASNKAAYVMRSTTTTGKKPSPAQTNNNNGRRKGATTPTELAALNDSTAPIPGASGLITVSGVSSTGLTLVWSMATDNVSSQAALQYKVLRSQRENLNNLGEAETNGTVLIDFTPNLNSFVVRNLTNASSYYYTVVVKDEGGNKALYATAGDLTIRYTFVSEGEDTFATTIPASAALRMNQVRVSPTQDTAMPAGVAIVRFSPNGRLVSEGGFALTPAARSGAAYVKIAAATDRSDRVSTGIAFSNSSGQNADISYSLVDANGAEVKTGVIALPANQQLSAFLDEAPFFAPASFTGTFKYSSTVPVSASGMRGITKSTGEFLFSSLPLSIDGQSAAGNALPLFVDGGGWSTEVVLMNRSSAPQHGTVQFYGAGTSTDAAPLLEMRVNGETRSTFDYSIPPQSIARFVTESTGTQMATGSVRITPTSGDTPGSTPDVVGILALKRDGRTVTESSIAAGSVGTAFRAYVEAAVGTQWINSSFALVNNANVPNVVSFQMMTLDGMPVGSVSSVTLPPGGHISKFVREIATTLPDQFQGLVRITSTAALGVSVFRCTYNAQGDFLYTPTPAVNEGVTPANGNLAFPMVATGAGYNTQLVLFGAAGQSGSGDLLFISKDGVPQTGSSLGVAQ
jgi:hypothetical protein